MVPLVVGNPQPVVVAVVIAAAAVLVVVVVVILGFSEVHHGCKRGPGP